MYTADNICKMIEFLIDNIFMQFGGHLFHQVSGISIGTNCAVKEAESSQSPTAKNIVAMPLRQDVSPSDKSSQAVIFSITSRSMNV